MDMRFWLEQEDVTSSQRADVRAVGALLIAEALCLACLETKSQIPRSRMGEVFEIIERQVRITTRRAKCAGCERLALTYRLGEHRAPWAASW